MIISWTKNEQDNNKLKYTSATHHRTLFSIIPFFIGKLFKTKHKKTDFYSLDRTMAEMIFPLLVEYLKQPNIIFADIDDKDFHDIIGDDDDELKQTEWIINQMIYSFHEIAHGYPDEDEYFNISDNDIYFVPHKDNTELSVMKYKKGHEPKIDEDGLQKYRDKIQNGLNLFGKYYLQLWT